MTDQRFKILIVDDEPFNVDYLEQELEDLQFDTVGAADGYEALELVAAESPDLILLDIMMPRMDGFEVLTRLKDERETRDIPVIIISALDDISTVVKGIKKAGGANTLVILQPMTKAAKTDAVPNGEQLLRWQEKVMKVLPNVRVIPQTHKMIEVL